MRYKAAFIAGVAIGFVAGSRAGRDAYDKMMDYGQQVANHPKVQQATSAAQSKATELANRVLGKATDWSTITGPPSSSSATTSRPSSPGSVRDPR